eukprot:TRINITY_DN12175_c0_g1_i1.p1 TRINITY_DN12175_c0_g1~~TRINITY_DN12175_c0_g1_i1.p1  ORF type:complete len:331 (+),score=48.32 TRINITY_DN12175_c0_g1_i1:155-1147(+)
MPRGGDSRSRSRGSFVGHDVRAERRVMPRDSRSRDAGGGGSAHAPTRSFQQRHNSRPRSPDRSSTATSDARQRGDANPPGFWPDCRKSDGARNGSDRGAGDRDRRGSSPQNRWSYERSRGTANGGDHQRRSRSRDIPAPRGDRYSPPQSRSTAYRGDDRGRHEERGRGDDRSRGDDRRRGDDRYGDRRSAPSPPGRRSDSRAASLTASRRAGGDDQRREGDARPASPPQDKVSADKKTSASTGAAGGQADDEEATVVIEDSAKRANGDPTWQACINVKGVAGRVRSLRGPPRPNLADAENDGQEMKRCYLSGGIEELRKLQQEQRRSRIK